MSLLANIKSNDFPDFASEKNRSEKKRKLGSKITGMKSARKGKSIAAEISF